MRLRFVCSVAGCSCKVGAVVVGHAQESRHAQEVCSCAPAISLICPSETAGSICSLAVLWLPWLCHLRPYGTPAKQPPATSCHVPPLLLKLEPLQAPDFSATAGKQKQQNTEKTNKNHKSSQQEANCFTLNTPNLRNLLGKARKTSTTHAAGRCDAKRLSQTKTDC